MERRSLQLHRCLVVLRRSDDPMDLVCCADICMDLITFHQSTFEEARYFYNRLPDSPPVSAQNNILPYFTKEIYLCVLSFNCGDHSLDEIAFSEQQSIHKEHVSYLLNLWQQRNLLHVLKKTHCMFTLVHFYTHLIRLLDFTHFFNICHDAVDRIVRPLLTYLQSLSTKRLCVCHDDYYLSDEEEWQVQQE